MIVLQYLLITFILNYFLIVDNPIGCPVLAILSRFLGLRFFVLGLVGFRGVKGRALPTDILGSFFQDKSLPLPFA